jgi:ABC-2 type transport system permease protein
MKTLYWLVRRELWEHKVELIWAPIATAMTFVGFAMIWAVSIMGGSSNTRLTIGDVEINPAGALTAQGLELITGAIATGMLFMVFVTAGLAGFVIANYCANALFDERKDRSILFWKSLPVSDRETVLSKVAVAVLIAPLIAVASIVVGTGLIALIGSVGYRGTEHGAAIGHAAATAFVVVATKLLAAFAIQLIWMIPSVGWFLLVSSIARSSPLLWGIGGPIGLLLVKEAVVYIFQINLESFYFLSTARWLGGTLPGSWYLIDAHFLQNARGLGYFMQLWDFINGPRFWIGTAFGISMMIVATKIRRKGVEV